MINLTQEMILTARARQCRAQLSVRKCSAKSTNTADRPERHDGKAGGQIPDLKAKAGEDASATILATTMQVAVRSEIVRARLNEEPVRTDDVSRSRRLIQIENDGETFSFAPLTDSRLEGGKHLATKRAAACRSPHY